ncbi:MAG TPA: HAMP domain-containing sensor histidine kinase [Lysobacter sp.]
MPASPPTDRKDPTPPAFDALVQACAAPSALVDPDGAVIAANAAFVARLGLPAGARLGDLDPAFADRQAFDHGGVPVAGGQLHLRPLDATHRLAQWLETPADRAAEQRQLQMFADTVAHDLRAPLRSIESFARLLDERASARLDAAERMHLSRIRAAATRMSGLLTALGELSRAASAAMQPSDVDLSLLAEWAIAELHDAEPGRDVVVHVQPGLHVTGDERLLRQMLRELLGNAWTFTRNVSPASIDVRGERVGDVLRLSIRDTGIGFDMQYARKLFQPFQRLHGADQGTGHGLGLAIAQRIAQRHGGGVTAESVEGQGSTFTVALPVANGE